MGLILSSRMQGWPTSSHLMRCGAGLPKTRSGKIMRRILRKIAEKKDGELGDVSTLLNPSVVDEIIRLRGK